MCEKLFLTRDSRLIMHVNIYCLIFNDIYAPHIKPVVPLKNVCTKENNWIKRIIWRTLILPFLTLHSFFFKTRHITLVKDCFIIYNSITFIFHDTTVEHQADWVFCHLSCANHPSNGIQVDLNKWVDEKTIISSFILQLQFVFGLQILWFYIKVSIFMIQKDLGQVPYFQMGSLFTQN